MHIIKSNYPVSGICLQLEAKANIAITRVGDSHFPRVKHVIFSIHLRFDFEVSAKLRTPKGVP